MEYSYKVYLRDKSVRLINDEKLQGKELDAYDKASITGKLDELLEINGIDKGLVSRITILGKTSNEEYEYNLIKDNPYFNDVFYYVKDKESDRFIDTESENYKEMRDYLFAELKYEPEFFFENIYVYKNKFIETLDKYAIAFNTNMNEVYQHNLYELESTIRKGLSNYKIYRTLASRRYEYDKKRILEEKEMMKQLPPREEVSLEPNYEQFVDEYNKKYDEFIEENEYSMMTGDDSGAKVR